MSVKMFSGYKFEGSFEDFQKKCFTLISDISFVKLLKEESEKVYGIIYEDIFYENVENKSRNIIVKSFLNYLDKNKDDKRFNFSKFKDNEDYKEVFNTILERVDTKIYYQMIEGVIYLWIKANEKFIKFLEQYFLLKNYSYWDNVDKDPKVSNIEWNKRKYFWKNKWNGDFSFEFEIFDFKKQSFLLCNSNLLLNNKYNY